MVEKARFTRRFLLAGAAAASLYPLHAQAQDAPELIIREGSLAIPPIKARRGQEFRLRVKNDTRTPLALHWRGLRIRNEMDGASPLTGKPVAPGETSELAFTPPDAGSFLCHTSLRDDAHAQMARGLAFPFIVEDESEPPVDLDLACLLHEERNESAQPPRVQANGSEQQLQHEVRPGARLRLRLIGGSTRRMMSVGLDGARAFVVAIDGQPCGLFEPERQTLPLAPGQRYDLFVDMPREAGQSASLVLRGAGETSAVAVFRTAGEPLPARASFGGLPPNPLLPDRIALEKSFRRDLALERGPEGWRISGAPATSFGPAPLFSVRRGTPVTLGFINRSGQPQLVHPHGHVMRHIHLFDDGWDPYWRDSIIVPDGRTMRVAFIADNPGRWALACGFDAKDGPLGWFEVT